MTPQTIDVTGLSPHSLEVVRRLVDGLRDADARAAALAPPDPAPVTRPDPFDHPARVPGTGPPPGETAEQWVARWKAWVASHPKRDGVDLDDSRESIYDRSTE